MEEKAKATGAKGSSKKPQGRPSNSTQPASQPTLLEVLEKSQPYERRGKRHAESTNAVTYCIAKDSLPIQTVERPGFSAMLKVFDSRY